MILPEWVSVKQKCRSKSSRKSGNIKMRKKNENLQELWTSELEIKWALKNLFLHILLVKWKLLSRVQLFVTPWTVVHGILQARKLKWVALPFYRGSSQPKDRTQVSSIAGGFFPSWATREALIYCLNGIFYICRGKFCLQEGMFTCSEKKRIFKRLRDWTGNPVLFPWPLLPHMAFTLRSEGRGICTISTKNDSPISATLEHGGKLWDICGMWSFPCISPGHPLHPT